MPSRPQQPSAATRLPLLDAARSLAEGREQPAARHRLVYQIVGGPPGKRFERTLVIAGDGSTRFEVRDDMAVEAGRRVDATLPRERVQELFRDLVDSRLFENVEAGGGFVPDSMVGIITFDDGTRAFSYYFPTDADTARRAEQSRQLNPSLQRMIAALEDIVRGLQAGNELGA